MTTLVTNQKVKFTPFREGKKETLANGVRKNLGAIPTLGLPVRIFETPFQMGNYSPRSGKSFIESILVQCKEWKQSKTLRSISDRQIDEHYPKKDWSWSWGSNTLVTWCEVLEKTLMLGNSEGRRRSTWQRMRWLDSFTGSTDMNLSKFWEAVKNREAWHATVHQVTKLDTI